MRGFVDIGRIDDLQSLNFLFITYK